MARVLVTGASGFIGSRVACALRAKGHTVFGLIRSEAKAHALSLEEIHPVIGDSKNTSAWIDIARKCNVFIHCAVVKPNFNEVDNAFVDSLLNHAQERSDKPMFIYTSGVIVLKETTEIADETFPIRPFGSMTARPANENKILTSPKVHGVVIRPGFVFGKGSKFFESYFAQAAKGQISVYGNRIAKVHIDDLVSAYVAVVENPPKNVSGEIFHIVDSNSETNQEIAKAFAVASGNSNVAIVDNPTPTWPNLPPTILVSNKKAMQYLSWRPKHNSIVDEAVVVFQAWKAAQPKQ